LPKADVRVAVLVSGGGSNLQAILDAQKAGQLGRAKVVLVLSSKAGVPALDRADKSDVVTAVLERGDYPDEEALQDAILATLEAAMTDVVALAGYMRKVGPNIVDRFNGKILNIHPALLPKYGGPGMYGHFVHEAVIRAGEKESGCSVHVVDEDYDHGLVLAQAKVPVLPSDTPETLAEKVLKEEHKLYPKTLKEFCESL
jgi:formyltetrahydrofolate-dependent phosphoribosylglycinamide formyltransferase